MKTPIPNQMDWSHTCDNLPGYSIRMRICSPSLIAEHNTLSMSVEHVAFLNGKPMNIIGAIFARKLALTANAHRT